MEVDQLSSAESNVKSNKNVPKMRTTKRQEKPSDGSSYAGSPEPPSAKKGRKATAPQDRKAAHSAMEKQYRSDMNFHIKRLMEMTPACKSHNGPLNKVQILSKASDWMQTLLDEREQYLKSKPEKELIVKMAELEATVKDQARQLEKLGQVKKTDKLQVPNATSPDEDVTPSTAVNPLEEQTNPGPIRRTRSKNKLTSPVTPDRAGPERRRRLQKSASNIIIPNVDIPETPSNRTQRHASYSSPFKSPVHLPVSAPLSAFNDPSIPASGSSASDVFSNAFAGPSFFMNPSLSQESLFSLAPSALETMAPTPMIHGYDSYIPRDDETVAAAAELLRHAALLLSPVLNQPQDDSMDRSHEPTPPSQATAASPSSLMMHEFIIASPIQSDPDQRDWEM